MKWYICASFTRRGECVCLAAWLKTMGHTVTSKWVYDGDDVTDDGVWADMDDEQQADWAASNLDGIDEADAIVIITEHPGSEYVRGGRHVETGYALALKRHAMLLWQVHIIGPAENCFHHIHDARRHASVHDFKAAVLVDDAEKVGG